MIVLPIFQSISARFSYDIELAGEIFHLKFNWNAREESWYMNILDQDQNPILTGIKMVVNYLLLNQYQYISDLPQGNFLLYDLEKIPGGVVTFDNLGKRYQLLFASNIEIEAGGVSI